MWGVEIMKNKALLKRLEKLECLIPAIKEEQHKHRKYSLDDWAIEDIRKVVFPEGRECFDPADKDLMDKWNNTGWLSREFLKLLSVEELRTLRNWMEKRKLEEVKFKAT